MSTLHNFIRQVNWNPIDYMIIDTLPGTGDMYLSLTQNLPITSNHHLSKDSKNISCTELYDS